MKWKMIIIMTDLPEVEGSVEVPGFKAKFRYRKKMSVKLKNCEHYLTKIELKGEETLISFHGQDDHHTIEKIPLNKKL